MKFDPHLRSAQAITAFIHDIAVAAIAFFLALVFRVGLDDAVARLTDPLLTAWLLFTVVAAGVFLCTGLYRGIWRYASMNDVWSVLRSATLVLLVFLPAAFLITRLDAMPRTSLIVLWFLLVILLSAPRMAYRVFKDRGFDHLLERDNHLRVPVLLVGAGDAAEAFIREMARHRTASYDVLAVVDEKGTRVGRRIHNVPVLGRLDQLEQIVKTVAKGGRRPRRLVLTKRLGRQAISGLLDFAEKQGMTLTRMPRLTDFRRGLDQEAEARSFDVQPVAIEDLLGRTQATLDREAMRALIAGRRVLVTGAGGSIGAELVRQLADFAPAHLSLMDNNEFHLYSIELELSESRPEQSRRAIIGDVRERPRLDLVMQEELPDVVFHAAALKHVPMVEANPVEGVLTNVIGTRNVADACRKAGVEAMVLISTDKAIEPMSVMGATKRLAECYCQALDILARGSGPQTNRPTTRFVTVRFGNVLGSTGSVVPLFQRQLARGGPLTVTDPEVRRYFMTVREAVQLVLQASALGVAGGSEEAGKIYVLDMGEPIKILDLAQQMVRLAGLRPGKDVEIVFTGMRHGEKLNEELFDDLESMLPTSHPSLRLAAPRTADYVLLARGLDELAELALARRRDEVLALLQRLVPDYQAARGGPTGSATAASG